jgi:flagellar secretion chaperone FliS
MYQSAYETYFEDRVLGASPAELVHLLYQGAIGAVQDARHHLANGKIAERSKAISKACAILTELSRSLDHKAGGELASRLSALYTYMRRKLLDANFRQNDQPMREVLSLLVTLAEGWEGISKSDDTTVPREQAAASHSSWQQTDYPSADSELAYTSGSWNF